MLVYRLLEQSVQTSSRTYHSIVVDPGSTRRAIPVQPLDKRVHCESLAQAPLDRPWRYGAE
jgi:hypothetical protein